MSSMSSSATTSMMPRSVQVPSEIVRKWQEVVDVLAEIMHVPSASIMRVEPPHIKVFVSSASKGNPCEPGSVDTGPYCATVMKARQPLLVADARANVAWKSNPHVQQGMISYLGVPISWPDGQMFGTICVRDNKRNEYSEAYLKLLLHFRDLLQADLTSWRRCMERSNSARRKSGGCSRPISSGSSSGTSKTGFSRPTKRFCASSNTIVKISSLAACAGAT
jgi:transcriptional regulator with GAF, ATPase, and Fis domain